MRYARFGCMGMRTAQFLARHGLMRYRLHHIRPGHEHIRGVLHHQYKIGDGGRIYRATRARAHDGRYLRHHARCLYIPVKNIGIAAQRHHTLLYPCATAVVEAYYRRAVLHRQVHDLYYLLGMGFGEAAAKYRKVLRVHIYQAAIHGAIARYHPITGIYLLLHPEVAAAMCHHHAYLFKRALIEQQLQPLARR